MECGGRYYVAIFEQIWSQILGSFVGAIINRPRLSDNCPYIGYMHKSIVGQGLAPAEWG